MNINLTLLGQMITFAIFIWFTMKYVWPPIMKAMGEREKKIADGLANADRAVRDLELAQHKSASLVQEAKLQASQIIDQANKRAARIVEESKEVARQEEQNVLARTEAEVSQAYQQAQEKLQKQVAELATNMAAKILAQHVDEKTQRQVLDHLVTEV